MYLRERTVIFNMDLKFDKLTLLITLTYLKHACKVTVSFLSPTCATYHSCFVYLSLRPVHDSILVCSFWEHTMPRLASQSFVSFVLFHFQLQSRCYMIALFIAIHILYCIFCLGEAEDGAFTVSSHKQWYTSCCKFLTFDHSDGPCICLPFPILLLCTNVSFQMSLLLFCVLCLSCLCDTCLSMLLLFLPVLVSSSDSRPSLSFSAF